MLAGLTAIFLPLLLEVFHTGSLTSSTAETSIGGGVTLLIGIFFHHGWITSKEVASGEATFEKIKPQLEAGAKALGQMPDIHARLLSVETLASGVKNRLVANEAKDVPAPIQTDIKALANEVLAEWASRASQGNAPVPPA